MNGGASRMRCLETISMKAGDVGRDLGATCCLVTVISSLVALPVPAAAETSAKALTGAVAASPPPSWTTPLSKDEKVLQLLHRITFGPRRAHGDQEVPRPAASPGAHQRFGG